MPFGCQKSRCNEGERMPNLFTTMARRVSNPKLPSVIIDHGSIPAAQLQLNDLIKSSIVLAEEVDDLPDEARHELEACSDKDGLLALLVKNRLLTEFQAERVDAGKIHGLILGNYRILDQLGRGGMGVVYKGEHLRMRRVVAIKVMPMSAEVDDRL